MNKPRFVRSHNFCQMGEKGNHIMFGHCFNFVNPRNIEVGGFISSDYRKALAIDARAGATYMDEYDRSSVRLNVEPRIRVGDHLFIIPSGVIQKTWNDYGFVPDT
ncbi:MAG: DUF5916 domain-containing protein, partial [Paracoccaceae bacterium]